MTADGGSEMAQVDAAAVMHRMFVEVVSALYQAIASVDAGATMTGTIVFDHQHRIAQLRNVMVNGRPRIPGFETLAHLNQITTVMNTLPSINALAQLEISVDSEGHLDARPTYVVSA